MDIARRKFMRLTTKLTALFTMAYVSPGTALKALATKERMEVKAERKMLRIFEFHNGRAKYCSFNIMDGFQDFVCAEYSGDKIPSKELVQIVTVAIRRRCGIDGFKEMRELVYQGEPVNRTLIHGLEKEKKYLHAWAVKFR